MGLVKRLITGIAIMIFSIESFGVSSPNGLISVRDEGIKGPGVVYKSPAGEIEVMKIICGRITTAGIGSGVQMVEYEMLTGNRSHCTNRFNEQCYLLASGDTMRMRLYDDGVAWNTLHPDTMSFTKANHTFMMRWNEPYEGFSRRMKFHPPSPWLRAVASL